MLKSRQAGPYAECAKCAESEMGAVYSIDTKPGFRIFIIPTGHTFTTLRKLRDHPAGYHLRFDKEEDENVSIITIEPDVYEILGRSAAEC